MSTEQNCKIALNIAGQVITATLNNSSSAKDLIKRLPCTVRLQKYQHDYCGVITPPLVYSKDELHNGWKNGEIAFAVDGSYFTILYKDEEISQQYGNLITIGMLSEDPAVMDSLSSEISIRIELL